ncbi:HNH endonuclease signature motif containing protein [Corynebacterium freiburgense]|uniref:HNH endonuclease signature motif containing protein n=1 Tax=Corynebacterium freiburgense TaxID=556548 RepID=UPI0012EB237B|nr:HNH endonuclease signature motif containing protein [Corynebacterium freiburgense]WJZ02937.1 hypothetical protein CFREI_08295 [Corynebacterium freiburgense]
MTLSPHFRIQAENNLIGQRTCRLNAEECCFYRDQVQAVEFASADLGKLAAGLKGQGMVPSQRTIQLMLGFAYRIVTFFPQVTHIACAEGLISVPMACAMEQVLQDLPADPDARLIHHIEDVLVGALTPTSCNQHLPSPKALAELLKQELKDAKVIGQPVARPRLCYGSSSTQPGMWTLTAEVDMTAGAMITRHLQAVANAKRLTDVEAFIHLLTGEAEATTVTVFGIGRATPGTTITVEALAGTGMLTTDLDTQRIQQLRIKYRNILELAAICRGTHDPGPILQALVRFRDGHCRYPGCMVPPEQCDIDHVINFEAGGWTCLSNLQCLCRCHHNMKTDRKLHASITPDGHVAWEDTDPDATNPAKHLGVTLPEGILAGLTGIPMPPRHSGKTEADDNTNPPGRHGMGRFGSTFDQYNARVHEQRNQNRTPPDQPPEAPF